jgi:hypothetical protein
VRSIFNFTMDEDPPDITIYIKPYDFSDLRNEPRPDSVIYTPKFRTLQEALNHAANILSQPLVGSKYHNDITRALLTEVVTHLEKGNRSETICIAVVGDMNAGTWTE